MVGLARAGVISTTFLRGYSQYRENDQSGQDESHVDLLRTTGQRLRPRGVTKPFSTKLADRSAA